MIIFTDNTISVIDDLASGDDSVAEDLASGDDSVAEDLASGDDAVEDLASGDASVAEDLASGDASVAEDLASGDASVAEDLESGSDDLKHSAQGETLQSVSPTIVNDIVVPDNSYSKYCFFFLMLLFALFVGRSFRKGV